MKKVYMAICFCLFAFSSHKIFAQAPANDDCSGAISVNTIPYNDLTTGYTNANTTGATRSTPDPSCITSSDNNDDVWYKFVAVTSTELLRVVSAVNGSTYTTVGYALYDGCGGTEIACNNQMGTFYGNEMLGGLTPGNTYYLRFWSLHNFTTMTFSFAVMDINPTTPADDPNNATQLSINSPGAKCIAPQFFTTASATRSSPDPSCSSENDDDVWFQFVMPANGVYIYVQEAALISSGSTPTLGMALVNASAGFSAGCSTIFGGTSSLVSSTAGDVFQIRIWTIGTTDRAVFSICLQDGFGIKPVNDSCKYATDLIVATGNCANPVIGNLFNADITLALNSNPNCTVNATLKNDVWYKATVPASGNLIVQTSATNSEVNDLVMIAYTNDCNTFTQIACDEDGNTDAFPSANHSRISLTGRTPGETILYRVLPRNASNMGQFSICAFDGSVVLPLTLTDFSASYQGKNVRLFWQTAQEHNTGYFDIERSIDGINFYRSGSIAAKGESNISVNYSFADSLLLSLNSPQHLVAYRLKIVDKNGKFTYSKIVTVNTGKALSSIKINPNPAKNILQVTGLNPTNPATISIIGFSGNAIKKIVVKNNSCLIDVSNLPAGIYCIKVQENKEITNLKFVKE
ncbi:MAG: T9SS type A sorting domain-containing protein [Ginsengibacter sp.]